MSKIALDRFYIITVFERDNSILVTQIMESKLRAAHLLNDPLETIVDSPIRQVVAFCIRKHEIGLFPFGS